jgi:hypothetical protein
MLASKLSPVQTLKIRRLKTTNLNYKSLPLNIQTLEVRRLKTSYRNYKLLPLEI